MIISNIFMPEAWSPETYKSNGISWEGVFAGAGPAVQAGLTTRRLTFREIFSSTMSFLALQGITLLFFDSTMLINVDDFAPFYGYGGLATLDGGSTGRGIVIGQTRFWGFTEILVASIR